jgi:mercuric ion transport protein
VKERSALVGSLIAGLLASACCIGPLLLGAVGLGSLGLATALAPLRPWLLGLTVVLIGAGFFLAYRPQAAEVCAPGQACAKPASRRNQRIMLWLVTALAAWLATYPSWGARLTVMKQPAAPVGGASSLVVLDVEGMTCPACEGEVERELLEVSGVVQASASFDKRDAEVRVLSPSPEVDLLIAAVEKAGYRAAVSDRRTER